MGTSVLPELTLPKGSEIHMRVAQGAMQINELGISLIDKQ